MTGELERQLAELRHGDHLCPIYESEEEQLDIVLSFIKIALARGERCLCIADAPAIEEFVAALEGAHVGVAHERERGALWMLTKRDSYLTSGEFDPRAMVDFLLRQESRALSDGYSGLGVVGEMTWALGPESGCDRLIEYEAMLNQSIGNSRIKILCQYDRCRFDPAVIHDVLRTHPIAILGDQVCPNPYYEPPELVLCEQNPASAEFKARRVSWWIEQLKRAKTAEQERERLLEQLESERARFEAVLKQMTAGVAIVEAPSGELLLSNEQLERIFGQPAPVVANIRDYAKYRAIHPDGRPYRPEEWPVARSIFAGEEVMDEEIEILRDDDRRDAVRVSSTPIRDGSGRIVAGVLTCYDITEQKRAQVALQKHADQLQGLAEVAIIINSARTPAQVTQAVTDAARRIVGAHQSVTGFTRDSNWAQAIQFVSLSEKYADYRDYDRHPDGSGIYSVVCQANRPMRLTQAQLEVHSHWRGFGEEAERHPPMRGWLAAPLVGSDGRNIGLIQLSDKYEGDFTADDEAILVQLAQMASVAIENAWLYEQVKTGHEHLRTLSRQLLEIQETERRHLARELHDEVGQTLTGLRLILKPTGDLPADEVKSRLGQARDIVDELLGRVRGLSFDLRPAALDQFGLLPALLVLFERYTAQTGVRVHFKHERVDERFAADVETTAYRIVQEALTNVARHAGVGEVTVRVWAASDMLNLQIEDRGRGFDPDRASAMPRSIGLAGMRERVTLLEGMLTIESSPGAGTSLVAGLPRRAPSRS